MPITPIPNKFVCLVSIGLGIISVSSADAVGKWRGFPSIGSTKVAIPVSDGDSLVKLQMSKAFIKSVRYEFDFKQGGLFTSTVRIPDRPAREGKGTWSISGNIVLIRFSEDNGKPSSVQLKGTVTMDWKKIILTIPGKKDLPETKIMLQKQTAPK